MENEFLEIAEQAKRHKRVQTLMHHVNQETLIQEHNCQKRGKATGVDGIGKLDYEQNLTENVASLVERMKSFSYRPQPAKRSYIPKEGSDKLRPLGIPAYEDKLVQGVMRRILDEVYEEKFCDFSYGFRRGRSAHQALHEINQILMTSKTSFVVDADIKGFFDHVNHDWLIRFLEHDIQDKTFIRYIKRFLKAGIVDEAKYFESDQGTPQGGLISPVMANVYLHYVLDIWFEKVVKKHLKGTAHMVRYADDFVCFFQYEEEARRFYKALEHRLKKFDLELATDKSKIIRFGRFAKENNMGKPTETFDFLGITHINGETRTGKYGVAHRTSKKKLKVKKKTVKEWLSTNMHEGVKVLIAKLNRKLAGHYAYYGISGNYQSLLNFYRFIKDALYKTLTRRSQRSYLNGKRYQKLLECFPIREPRICVNIWQPL